MCVKLLYKQLVIACQLVILLAATWPATTQADDYSTLPIADAHVHYSHDSVELTPPERVIELMRSANLKLALVSSSDDKGTQLLSALAPDLIIPGLRPYRQRGELYSWFTDNGALQYVEDLLSRNQYASIGEFHINGDNADLPIPTRLVELADQYNLVLHAHSDANAIARLLAQSKTVNVLWAHAGFENPSDIGDMLRKHDRLWSDLAFRGDVGSGGHLSKEWIELFEEFPDRIMLGTDTYTPERIYFIPEHASGARTWLSSLPYELAERVAWKNAHDLLMPIWRTNRELTNVKCHDNMSNTIFLKGDKFSATIETNDNIVVSQPFSATVSVCSDNTQEIVLSVDATMPAHGHGMNYTPEITLLDSSRHQARYLVEGMVLHMPGQWQWSLSISSGESNESLQHVFDLN